VSPAYQPKCYFCRRPVDYAGGKLKLKSLARTFNVQLCSKCSAEVVAFVLHKRKNPGGGGNG